MRHKIYACLFLFPTLCFAQTDHRFAIEVVTGIQTGWWLYNRGSSDPNLFNNQGWDRTHHMPFVPLEANALLRLGRFKVGAGVNYSLLFDEKMIGSRDSDRVKDRYPISTGSMKLLKYNLQGEFELIRGVGFVMSPNVKLGLFEIDTLHPQKDNFGRKLFWEVGLTNEVRLSKFSFILRPIYSAYGIAPKEPLHRNEQHDIYSFGLNLGFRFWLK